jgi:hypothetical protein
MTDLELTERCADAMGVRAHKFDFERGLWILHANGSRTEYAPLRDDAQCLRIIKAFNLMVNWNSETEVWCMPMDQAKYGHLADSPNCGDLNRAVCECVARLKEAR